MAGNLGGRIAGGHVAGCIALSYITCLNKRNLPEANKAKNTTINIDFK